MLIRTLAAFAALLVCTPAVAHRPLAEVTITDRATGETLPLYSHRGERWIAGTPGNRYAITLHNRSAGRVLAVLSVDGVNAITGQTAAWDQAGYVLGPGERAEIRGWRKDTQRIAAFEFTALPDAYATRTGRPEHVGVIGVALFREAAPVVSQFAPGVAGAREKAAPAPMAEAGSASADAAARAENRLGTGHGRSESSIVQMTRFERAQPNPDQVLAIRYDSRANLIAMGVLSAPPAWRPEPFPGVIGFVPDPPRP
jgi:hypothetical protein